MTAIDAKLTWLAVFRPLLRKCIYAACMPRRKKYDPDQMGSKTERDQAARIDELMRKVERLTAEVNRLSKENADLRRRLKSNSRNSSRPPSSDRYKKPKGKADGEKREGQSQKRKRGAQPGHKGTQRKRSGRNEVAMH